MKKTLLIASSAALLLCGCGTLAERIADAIEPRIEALVDKQIEREEKLAGIWGTTNSYFYVAAEAEAAKEEAKKQEVLSALAELIAANQDKLLAEAEKLVNKKLKEK